MSTAQIIMSLLGLLTGWSGVLLWSVKWAINSTARHYIASTKSEIDRLDKAATKREERIAENTRLLREIVEKLEKRVEGLEKEKLIMEKDISEKYQKREDSLRELALIDAKLEHIQTGQTKLWLRVEQIYASVTHTGSVPSLTPKT